MATKKESQEDALGIGGVGGFVDTVGETKRKRRGHSESSEAHEHLSVPRDAMKDEVEERLEEILFGRRPFNPVLPSTSDTDGDSEAEEDDVSKEEWAHILV